MYVLYLNNGNNRRRNDRSDKYWMVTCFFIYNFYVFINKVRNINCSQVKSSVNTKNVIWIGFQELLHVFHLVSSITSSATFPVAPNRSFFFALCFKLQIWWWSRGALSKSLIAKSLHISEHDCFWLRRPRISSITLGTVLTYSWEVYFALPWGTLPRGQILEYSTMVTVTCCRDGYCSGRFSNQLTCFFIRIVPLQRSIVTMDCHNICRLDFVRYINLLSFNLRISIIFSNFKLYKKKSRNIW
jgi:hypothetical protein